MRRRQEMPGKLCTGATTNNSFLPRESRAFSEGLYYRHGGTAAGRPITGNPHDGTGSSAETAWDAGWTVADDAAVGPITASNAPCVAVPSGDVVDT